jgi:hypothetical protein
MGVQDLIVTPIYVLLFLAIAFMVRPYVSNSKTRKFFIPALLLKFFGAIALGVIYFYYYEGGDTINFWHYGSHWIWMAFRDNPIDGIRLLFSSGVEHVPELYQYSQHIWYYKEPSSYFIVRLAAIFDVLTFHTYTSTALFFAIICFSGLWALYSVLQTVYKSKWLVYAILFVPSTIFWGSGILKDTVTLGAVCWLTYACFQWIVRKKRSISFLLIVLISSYTLSIIKLYILLCFLPALAIWIYWTNLSKIKNVVLKFLIAPMLLIGIGLVTFFSVSQISSDDNKYAINSLAERAAITAYDIRYGWGATAGGEGGYDIGELDGTWGRMFSMFPAAVNVSLFRPYLWEIKNPLMLLSAIEALLLLILTITMVLRNSFSRIINDPFLIFCLSFSIMFAFAVGVSTYNFGSLMRYKIPMLPFFVFLLIIMNQRKFRKIG